MYEQEKSDYNQHIDETLNKKKTNKLIASSMVSSENEK